jgi:beta-mannan synthase
MLSLLFGAYYGLYVTLLHAAIQIMVLLSLLVSADRVINVLKYVLITTRAKLTGTLPHSRWTFKPLPKDPHQYPKVAVQLPMFNERAVCQAIIDCCCELEWPSSRLYIQILDDSTDKVTRELVDEKVTEWRERGMNVECMRRTNRQGYKAGAMKEGMDILAERGYEHVAVFDADFKPEPDFLLKTVPWLEGNPSVGYVQTRWVFTNPDESYLTKAQEVSLNYHMRCEQFTHSATGSFFNFNGTAGVWRRACIETAGGWNSRTTVEDMDLSLRAYVKGWKAIFLEDVTCLNELPASFFAFRKQQHRWTCGPVQLWTRAAADIWASSIPLPRKIEVTVMYFGVRKVATHFVALGFFCTLVPLAVFTPEIHIPAWVLVHFPVVVTMSTAWFTPRGWVYSILYVLFENAMGMVKLWAVVTGILDLQRAQEWVVTTKLGSSDKRPGTTNASLAPSCKIYGGELLMGLFLLTAGSFGLFSGRHWGMSSYLLIQGAVFFSFGFNMVDVGGFLGGRLDTGLIGLSTKTAATKRPSPKDIRRRQTIPVIQLHSQEHVPLTATTLAAKSAPGPLARLNSMNSMSVLDPEAQARSSSPTHSAGSSDTERSVSTISTDSSTGTGSSGKIPSLSVIKLEEKWHSPTTSMTNIYATSSKQQKSGGVGVGVGGGGGGVVSELASLLQPAQLTAAAGAPPRKGGWSFNLFGNSGYQADHSD